MKRLEIAVPGTSQAMAELARELELHGHGIVDRQSPANHGMVDLLLDDGTTPRAIEARSCLQVRVALRTLPGEVLPQPVVIFRDGAQRLLCQEVIAPQSDGNGQSLRLRTLATVVETGARLVSQLSRDDTCFDHWPTVHADAVEQPLLGLDALEPLAFEHGLNRPPVPWLLAAADMPVLYSIEQRMLDDAAQPALWVDGQFIDYKSLRRLALGLQEPMLQKLSGAAKRPLVIGVCLPKSTHLYAAILAVLGCGAVYLPLDPQHPAQRRRFILENAQADLLLHDGDSDLGDLSVPTLNVHQLPSPKPGIPASVIRRTVGSDEPAVAIYTSGTTGQPKGVLLSHRNLSHFCAWYGDYVGLQRDSRALQFSTINFDASLLDILPTFIHGALLVVPSEDQRRDPQQLVALIHQQHISHAFLPPALLSVMPLDAPLGLAHLITGGDVCEPFVIEQLAPQCQFHNIYGPTETTVLATTRQFGVGDNNRNLGVPIANGQVLILDEQLQPVPQGVPGELYIAGPGVGLGYLNDPTLTATRYLDLTLPTGQVLRVYRTGDIGQWTDNGIELCGRRDNQVKIRGFRVEPEEIEHCLRDSQMFRQVAVGVDERRRILAFLVHPEHSGDALQALRDHVQNSLPSYMHPAAYVELPSLPYTSNGKVDRRALLTMAVQVQVDGQRRQPQNALETQLQQLWAELLELPVEDIATDESFFNLGGHSILLSRLLLSIRQTFGRSLSINRFIEAPTLMTLAKLLDDPDQNSASILSPQAFIDAEAELNLDPLPISQCGDVHKVVVTGANSFLGVHIVEALLAWGATEVACLVRASAEQSAAERFSQALRDNHLTHLDLDRVSVYAADITQPQLGLPDDVYTRIDRTFGALVHNAAHVNHVLDYESLARDNVEPIFECLRLCEGRSKKIFNFVSTLSASSALDADGQVLEQPAAKTPPIYIKNGYNLSKWVGERILQRARDRGVWVNLFRPGNISFNSLTGVCQPHKNRLMLMLKGSIQLGQVPELSLNFDLMPVDFLARFIAFHASRYQPTQAVFNLHNPQPLSWDAYVASFRDSGREFSLVSVAEWQRQLARVDADNALFGVLGFYLNGFEEDIGDISLISHDNARAGVRQMGASYPEKSPALLRRGAEYLKAIDFI
ncbi:amino acid adenylation domain-containing protein/thioester reductase domain-containing protein [Pseudomonas sp. NFACC23-1]|uniref:non-ribosomal peptide synthetase n=1 Tax=unclassified Pseudomonas TaxID=196821 RepID=UPI0008826BBB|nr:MULTISPECIES: non-ribosomal peptide synthetase [unclassified Pseudomonas]SDB67096.1 amino acid adenylation domain-containing protein/thioester reductase domain-containing protein [Pseudomonas sp. NFACC17-2]SEJ98776.1 amino acid adenylation domain-containing protein/thioester reductase domain-containing protein [Pseudomonas sp. NFACC23-1]SFW87292.1 amino acid adenylation domain-containing protein/thioester reductase domain-containing protein [Pseudomonas sp. NFACC16-2]